jgi:hypothetical protein
MASPYKMTAVELEAAIAAHKALIEGHKEEFAKTAEEFATRRFRAGGYDFDYNGVQKILGIHPSGKQLAFKFLPHVRAQFEAQWASNKADYDSWMKSAKTLREQDLAKLTELEAALEEIFVPEEVPDVVPGSALLAALAAVGAPILTEEDDKNMEAVLAELDAEQHKEEADDEANMAEKAVRDGDSEEADDAFNPPGLYDREQWMNEGKLPEAESWADAADDDEATAKAEKLAKLKRMFAQTQPGKSYAAAIRA